MSNRVSRPSSSAPSKDDKVVQFRRADASAASVGLAGDDTPPVSSPPSLGILTQAVVLRLANKRIRIRVAGPGREEE